MRTRAFRFPGSLVAGLAAAARWNEGSKFQQLTVLGDLEFDVGKPVEHIPA